MKKFAPIALFAFFLAASPSFADSVNLAATGADGTAWVFGTLPGVGQETLAAQFTLSSATQIDQVTLGIADFNHSGLSYGVAIVNALTGGATLWSAMLSGSDPAAAVSITLDAGTYYLLGPTTPVGGDSATFGWNESSGTLLQTGGSVQQAIWADAILSGGDTGWSEFAGNSLEFSLSGATLPVTPTPEPASAALFATGIFALALLAFHRRRAQAGNSQT